MGLESIVRPFQTRPFLGRGSITVVAPTDDTTVLVTVGAEGGNVKTLTGSRNITTSYYCDSKSKAEPKLVQTQRIKNPDDESQYVDVEVTKKVTKTSGGGQDYQKTVDFVDLSQLNSSAEIVSEKTYD